jgi:hypothetical protein
MPGYIKNVLNKFQHDAPRTPQHTPSKNITPVYGAKMQFSTQDNSPPLTAKQCTEIQKNHWIRFILLPRIIPNSTHGT